MFGLYKILSILSIAHPFYESVKLLKLLFVKSHNNAISALTETTPMTNSEVESIQASLVYWILLSFWLFVTSFPIVSFFINVIPLSSLVVLYIQVWLGFNIVPYFDNGPRVSGSYIIFRYYFDNDMSNLKNVESMGKGLVIKFINIVFRTIDYIPILNMTNYKYTLVNYTKDFFNITEDEGATQTTPIHLMGMHMLTGVYGLLNGIVIPKTDDSSNNISKVILLSLLSPFTGVNTKSKNPFIAKETKSESNYETTEQLKEVERHNSFDDFAIVSEKEICELKVSKRDSKSSNSKDPEVDRKASATSLASSISSLGKNRSMSRGSWFGR